ncbi:hypothetical protein H257_13669 [Aphanomyces astaci]|uniref:Structure-specific endonuclease subunit SLX1 homolog n=1 Tax=Aphanomyces astaci TaxID=112090 RepID=W4FTX3_APHAT|nr:hypothetical protein H257_13669 [Aphanomyces astaci]ETV70917.1 hypothetical protein H257_13669 [Aphanomyces astaci]|eukprot:XP_009839580.1 hypothetical protein H257_13669 [Aphanomyces astaci]
MFLACYLLTPADPKKHMRMSYIGFTVSPKRRIRQHNGELVQGAKKTFKHRPWEMLLVVYGFPTKELALQFEWVWQHPYNSRFTKPTMGHLKTDKSLGPMRSIQRKVRELHLVLNLAPWSDLSLTLSYTSHDMLEWSRTLNAFRLPPVMRTVCSPLDDLPTTTSDDDADDDAAIKCDECSQPIACRDEPMLHCYVNSCAMKCHVACLSKRFQAHHENLAFVPQVGTCPLCLNELTWSRLLTEAINPVHSKSHGHTVTPSSSTQQKKPRRQQLPPTPSSSPSSSSSRSIMQVELAQRRRRRRRLGEQEPLDRQDDDDMATTTDMARLSDDRQRLTVNTSSCALSPPSLEQLLPSPAGRRREELYQTQPVIFPGSPIWHDGPTTNDEGYDAVRRRGGRPRFSRIQSQSSKQHTGRVSGPQQHSMTELKGDDEWECVVVFGLVGVLWVVGVCLSLFLVRFPVHVYTAQAILIVLGPLMPLYWLVRQLFQCASHMRPKIDDNNDDDM